MPIGAQPRGARGTIGRPYSALNLRLLLASCGLLVCLALTAVLWVLGNPVAATGTAVLALIGLSDIVVIQLRRRQRRRTDTEKHSLFE